MGRVCERARETLRALERLCRAPYFVALYGLIAVILVSPAASNGLQTEDHLQRAAGWTLHIYPHGSGDVYENYHLKDAGFLPWIASDDLKISFFRPLASLSLSFDYQVLPANPVWPYLDSFLWLFVLTVSAALLFRRINATWGGGALAALLFAFDDAHGVAVTWLATRHALMAAALATAALVLFDVARRDSSRRASFLCSVVFSLGLLSSEFALSALGYFLAYTLVLDAAPWRTRLKSALAYLVPAAAWLVVYLAGHYGTRGSGIYISPLEEPFAAASAVFTRIPWLIAAVFGMGTAELGNVVPDEGRVPWAIVVWVVIGVIVLLLVPVVRKEKAAKFWLVGLLLASIPLGTTTPSDRFLLLIALSGMALVDLLIRGIATRTANLVWRIGASVLALGWLVVHGVFAPMLLPSRARTLLIPNEWLEHAVQSVCEGARTDQQLVVFQAPNYYVGSMIAGVGWLRGCGHVRVLHAGFETPIVTRTDDRTLLVHTERGFIVGPLDRVYRSESRPFVLGQGLQLSGVQIIVRAVTVSGAPRDVEFRFAWPLENEQLQFVGWNGRAYTKAHLPGVGERVPIVGFLDPPPSTTPAP